MYKYPNGLTCEASAVRVKLFEALVPPLCAGALLVGFIFAMVTFYNQSEPFVSLLKGAIAGTAWAVVCGLVGYLMFILWCKPRADQSVTR